MIQIKPAAMTAAIRGEFSRHPVKRTALLYLKEVLVRQEFELCAEIIAIAREFGAKDIEIRTLLEDPRRTPG